MNRDEIRGWLLRYCEEVCECIDTGALGGDEPEVKAARLMREYFELEKQDAPQTCGLVWHLRTTCGASLAAERPYIFPRTSTATSGSHTTKSGANSVSRYDEAAEFYARARAQRLPDIGTPQAFIEAVKFYRELTIKLEAWEAVLFAQETE